MAPVRRLESFQGEYSNCWPESAEHREYDEEGWRLLRLVLNRLPMSLTPEPAR